jgi:hypothetical protein
MLCHIFPAESEAKQSAPRKKAGGARARNVVEDINGRRLASARDEEGIPFMPQTVLLRREADRGFETHLVKPDTNSAAWFSAVLHPAIKLE